ncbi:MAG: Stp1/IreP family PP2C-type Ser/Thr phosphatase [Clostridiaceae bacterium]|jgi:protein phosphatase|nr:Stp1/IreP family PP2C-type Ser/Thr phosphatase [Clostridiaceae bacterium]
MYAGATDKGLIRINNEDCYAILTTNENLPYVLIVADGLGGHRKGELASRIAVDYAVSRLDGSISSEVDPAALAAQLRDVIEKANVKVYLGSLEDEENQGMGTTLTISVVLPHTLVTAHIGDSRAYLLRDSDLTRITIDHTLVQELLEAGDLTPEQTFNHPKRNVITRALGVPEYMQADTFIHPLRRGDRVLLCSDGLHGYVREAQIRQILRKERDPSVAAARLIERANAVGGEDNITVVLCFL